MQRPINENFDISQNFNFPFIMLANWMGKVRHFATPPPDVAGLPRR
jgi:hypothetical protein